MTRSHKMSLQLKIDDLKPKHFKRAEEDAAYFAEKFLGYIPHWYQLEMLTDPYRFKAVTMGRQLGKTFVLSLKASHQINMFPDSRVAITAQNEKRAFEIYNMVKKMQYRHPIFKDLLQPKNDTKHKMELDNGSTVDYYAVGTEGKAVRGDTLNLMLMDEADYVPDLVYTATIPTVTATGGDILITSTPYKPYSMFHEIFMSGWNARMKFLGIEPLEMVDGVMEEPYKRPVDRQFKFASYHYPYTVGLDVVNRETGLPQTDMDVVNIIKNKDYFMFEREYMAKWSDEIGTFIPLSKITAQLRPNNFHVKGEKFYAMGLDFGRLHDYTALVIYEITPDRDYGVIVDSKRIRRNDWQVIFQLIIKYLKKYNVSELYYDANNVGDVIGNWLRSLERYGFDCMLIPIKFSIQTKTVMYNNLKMAITTNRLFIQEGIFSPDPQYGNDNAEVIKELSQIQADETSTGLMKLHAPETTGKFDDLADAAALGAKAMSIPTNSNENVQIDIMMHGDFDPDSDDFGFDDSAIQVIGDDFDVDFSGSFDPLYEF